ncbi:MAG: hypothetical protein EPN39_07675 [Chitinophagaceae bacterium]|nr:MAG: hypothetical protein EPN39_07675 [Chitinophagaceae bacterium]
MAPSTIRDKLSDYIRVADEKKIHASYDLLEDEIEESILWWRDEQFVKELDIRYKALERGNDKGYSISQTKEVISNARRKKYDK